MLWVWAPSSRSVLPSARRRQKRSSSSTESRSSGGTPKHCETAGRNSLSLYKPFCFNKIFNSISCYSCRPFVNCVLGEQSMCLWVLERGLEWEDWLTFNLFWHLAGLLFYHRSNWALGFQIDTQSRVTPLAHCIRPSTDLIDFAWGDPEMQSVRYVGSVSCVQKLRKFQLFRLRRIRQPIRSRYVGQISLKAFPPSVRHASRRPLTDGCSGRVTLGSAQPGRGRSIHHVTPTCDVTKG